MNMRRVLLTIGLAAASATIARAQSKPSRWYEFGVDNSGMMTRASDVAAFSNPSVSFRVSGINTATRFTFDERYIIGDQRVTNQRGVGKLMGYQGGWRLGPRDAVRRSINGPYLLFGFTNSFSWQYLPPELDRHRYPRILMGYFGGMGIRGTLLQTTVRAELFAQHDHGMLTPDNEYWIPNRNSLGVRFSYSILKRLGDDEPAR